MNKKIVLDAGHGGVDSGAVSISPFELHESEVNMDVVEKLHDILVAKGYDVLCTREADVAISLSQRVSITNKFAPDAFISVHCNSSDNAGANGTETIYRDENDLALAESIQHELVQALKTKNRGVRNDIEYLKKKLMVLSNNNIPSCLVEVAFISNSTDIILLLDSTLIANAIATGVEQWFNSRTV